MLVAVTGMWIGKREYLSMKKTLLLLLLLIQQNALASDEERYAWWLMIEFPVTESKILSQPVSSLNKNWVKASLLTDTLLKKMTQPDEYKEFKDSRIKFRFIQVCIKTKMPKQVNSLPYSRQASY